MLYVGDTTLELTMSKRICTNDDWYTNDSGRVMYRSAASWLTAAIRIDTCQYIIKNHLTKEVYTGHGRTPRLTSKKVNRKMMEIIRLSI